MARRRRSKQEAQEDREVTRIEKASYWLADALTHAVKVATDPMDDRGDPVLKRRLEHWRHDAQHSLAISLEAYALALTEKDADRAEALIADLELGPRGMKRPRGGHHYFDLLEIREIGRGYYRDQEKRKKQIAMLEALGVRTAEQQDELKQLRALVKRWEEDGY